MNHIPWVPVVEVMPPEMEIVIVGQGDRVFAGWMQEDEDGPCWYQHLPKHPDGGPALTVDMGDVRATDFWLSLPVYPPTDNCVRGGYPA